MTEKPELSDNPLRALPANDIANFTEFGVHMKLSSCLLLTAMGLAAPLLSAETLSLCVKANGAARFAKQCNP